MVVWFSTAGPAGLTQAGFFGGLLTENLAACYVIEPLFISAILRAISTTLLRFTGGRRPFSGDEATVYPPFLLRTSASLAWPLGAEAVTRFVRLHCGTTPTLWISFRSRKSVRRLTPNNCESSAIVYPLPVERVVIICIRLTNDEPAFGETDLIKTFTGQ